MEERLDDALNVLRNHCEPQLGIQISNMDGSAYVGSSPVVNTPGAITQDDVTNEPPTTVKLERVPSNSSMHRNYKKKPFIYFNDLITLERNIHFYL